MPYLRHFKWAICLNIFLSLPHLFLIISSTYSWAMGGLLCSLPVSRARLPPLNTSFCLHNTVLLHAGKFLNWVQMNGALSEGLFLLTKICMQVLTSAAVKFSRLFWVDLQTTHWGRYDEASSWWFSDCSNCSEGQSQSQNPPPSACRMLLKATVLARGLCKLLGISVISASLSLLCLQSSGNLCVWELKLAKSAINVLL